MKFVLTSIGVLLLIHSTAQQPKNPVSIPSPNAASLGIFGQIPVDFSTGLPNISIPLHTIADGGVSIPITLSYHSSGVRPDHHPSWVGLNWSLMAGGAVTRTVLGDVDERPVIPVESGDINSRSYLYNYGALNRTDWDQASTLIPLMQNYQQTYPFTSAGVRPSPDEFAFNFGGYSGNFYLNHLGIWKVKCSNSKALKVDVSVAENFEINTSAGAPSIMLRRIIYEIKITTPDGFIWIFGGTPQSVEFSRTPGARDEYFTQVVATTWNLTKVQSPSGQQITLTYERDGYNIIVSDSWFNYYVGTAGGGYVSTQAGPGSNLAQSLITPSYLTKIETEAEEVLFTRQLSNQLKYTENINPFLSQGGLGYPDIGGEGSRWFKLNEISVKKKISGSIVGKFAFTYRDISTSRLMLLSLQEKDGSATGTVSKPPYTFNYDETNPLPEYNSRKLDHWGFYNGVNFFASLPPNYNFTPADEPAYKISRDPSASLTKSGMIASIIYPTGGETLFEFEAGDYSFVATTYPFNINPMPPGTVKKTAGGVRIKKITNKTNGNPDVIKEYFYNKSDAADPNTSSGILGGEPVYVERLNLTTFPTCYNLNITSCVGGQPAYAWYFFNRSVWPMSYTKGNHVAYSEVKEKLSDGSSTIYKYTNYDNAEYRDKPVTGAAYMNGGSTVNLTTIDMSLERGLLKSQEYRNSVGILKKKNVYNYNDNALRFNDNVRIVTVDMTTAGIPPSPLYPSQVFAYVKYLYEPYLKSITTYTYDNVSGPEMSETRTIEYDENTLLITKETTTGSDGIQIIKNYKYPKDKLLLNTTVFTSPDLQVVDEMILKNIQAPRLEEERVKGTSVLSTTYTVFGKWLFGTNTVYAPHSIRNKKFVTGTYETLVNYHQYDEKGNVREYSKNNDYKTSYLWDYNKKYPVAEVINANSSEMFYTSFETDYYGNWAGVDLTKLVDDNTSPTGEKCYRISSASSASILNASGLDASKKYTLSYWAKGGATNVFYYSNGGGMQCMPVGVALTYSFPGINGWNYYEYTIENRTNISVGCASNYLQTLPCVPFESCNEVFIDELRIYPGGALMTTHTYDLLVGMTSSCNANNRITYYEYDSFNRLVLIRDYNNNILKKICYNYAGQPENCTTTCTNTTANWQNTTTPLRCQTSGGQNTGYQEQEQKDMNPCSPTYNQLQWIVAGYNTTACPLPSGCTYSNCEGTAEYKKCVNGVCENGWKVYTSSYYSVTLHQWVCTYHWEWSDGSWSQDYTEYSTYDCMII